MKLKRKEAGVYVTEDGRFEISKGHCYTECDNPHPVQIAKAIRTEIRDLLRQHDGLRQARIRFGSIAIGAVMDNRRGYMCYGGEEHWRVSWGVWDLSKDDYVPGGEDFETKAHAVAFLEGMI